jgi:transposase
VDYEEMITMSMYSKIRRLRHREGMSISEIGRRTGLARNTIKRWLKESGGKEPRYRRQAGATVLTPFETRLKAWLGVDSKRPKRDRRTALALYAELKRAGYAGSYARLTEYLRRLRTDGSVQSKSSYVPLRFSYGEAFQFDWSEESLVVGTYPRKVQVAHIKLCASKAFLLVAYPAQSHEMLFDAHTRAFRVFGGIPQRGIYDNMKTAVDKVGVGKHRIVNTRFAALTAHYLFEADFCNVASGWEKGVVEKNVQDSRRRVWQAASLQRFGSFTALNVWLEQHCQHLWQSLSVAATGGKESLTVAQALLLEREALMPMVPAFDGYVETTGTVTSTSVVSIDRNRYSVPCRLTNQKISIRLYAERVELHDDSGLAAQHPRCFERGEVIYDWQHYLGLVERKPGALRNGAPFDALPEALQRLRRALLKRAGGDRLMAEMLACVPAHGLEEVLVAAELLLESGNLSAEHVKNILARLQEPPRPPTLETTLSLSEVPLADTRRYDHLCIGGAGVEVGHA